jgi:enoyl-CoA hydratase/carnithine racemase
MTHDAYVTVSRPRPNVAEVMLSRPERRNVLSLDALAEIGESLATAAADPDVGAIVLSAAGPSFCAGADLTKVHNHELGDQSQPGLGGSNTWELLETVPVPVIAAVQGHAVAGGFHLAVCCDLIVAAEDAVFRDVHAALGLIPGSGEPQRIVRRLGLFRARELFFTCRPLSAQQALEWGLVNTVVPVADVQEAARDLAAEIAAMNRRTVRYLKQMLNSGFGMPYGEARWADAVLTRFGQVNQDPDPDRDQRLAEFRSRRKKASR